MGIFWFFNRCEFLSVAFFVALSLCRYGSFCMREIQNVRFSVSRLKPLDGEAPALISHPV